MPKNILHALTYYIDNIAIKYFPEIVFNADKRQKISI